MISKTINIIDVDDDHFSAMKCNPDAIILKILDTLGVNFDCASKVG